MTTPEGFTEKQLKQIEEYAEYSREWFNNSEQTKHLSFPQWLSSQEKKIKTFEEILNEDALKNGLRDGLSSMRAKYEDPEMLYALKGVSKEYALQFVTPPTEEDIIDARHDYNEGGMFTAHGGSEYDGFKRLLTSFTEKRKGMIK